MNTSRGWFQRVISSALLAVLLLFGMPAHSAVPDPDPVATAISTALKDVAASLDRLGEYDELGEALPFVSSTPSDLLALGSLFSATLTSALNDVAVFDSLQTLEDAINAAGAELPGFVSFDAVNVAQVGPLVDVDFTVNAALDDLPVPIVVGDGGAFDLLGGTAAGNLTTDVTFTAPLSFQFDTTVLDPNLAFAMDTVPQLGVTISADAITGFLERFGLSQVDVTGVVNQLTLALQIDLSNPDGLGGITLDELVSTAIDDLATVEFTNPAGTEVDLELTLDPTLDGVPSATITLTDDNPIDGFNLPTFPTAADFTNLANVSIDEFLGGLSSFVSGIGGAQLVGDVDLPFLNGSVQSRLELLDGVFELLMKQVSAVVVCRNAAEATAPLATPTDTTWFCQAHLTEPADPGTVDWNAVGGTVGVNETSNDTVGSAPSAFVRIDNVTPTTQITVDFSLGGVPGTAEPRVRDIQQLADKLGPLGFGAPAYDPATGTVTLDFSRTHDPAAFSDTLNVGNQLSSVGLVGLSPTSAATASVDIGEASLNAGLGVILTPDVAAIEPGDEAEFPPGIIDRFVLLVDGGAPELSIAGLSATASADLHGQMGFLEVHAAGPLAVTSADLLSLDILPDTTGGGVQTGTGTLTDAILVRHLLADLAGQVTFGGCQLAASGSLSVDTAINAITPEIAGATAGVSFDWPTVLHPAGAAAPAQPCTLNHDTLTVTPSLEFTTIFDSLNIDTSNPLALLSTLLDNLEALAALFGEDTIGDALNADLPIIGISPGDLLQHVRDLDDTLDQVRSGMPPVMVSCGTDPSVTSTIDGETVVTPPSGDLRALPAGSTVYCHAETLGAVAGAADGQWVLETPSARTTFPFAVAQADPASTTDVQITLPAGGPWNIGQNFEVLLKVKQTIIDDVSEDTGRFPRIVPPRSVQQLERLLEDELGLDPDALAFAIEDVPVPGGGGTEQALTLRLGAGVCSTGHARCGANKQVESLSVPLNLNLGDLGASVPGLVDASSDGSLDVTFSARAGLDLAFPLSGPALPYVLDTTGASVEAAVDATALDMRATVGPLEFLLGDGVIIRSGTHNPTSDPDDPTTTMTDPAATPAFDTGTAEAPDADVPVGATLVRNPGGSEQTCTILARTATTISCVGASIEWEDGDAYEVRGYGTALLDAALALRTGDETAGNESFALGDVATNVAVAFGGLDVIPGADSNGTDPDNDCGEADDGGTPVALAGDACARFAVAVDHPLSDGLVYLGDVGFSMTLGDPTTVDETVFEPDLDGLIGSLQLDFATIFRAITELLGRVQTGLDGASTDVSVPLIGDALDAGADVAGALKMLADEAQSLADTVSAAGSRAAIADAVQTGIYDLLGPAGSGADLMLDLDGAEGISKDDVLVHISCTADPCPADTAENLLAIEDIEVAVNLGQIADGCTFADVSSCDSSGDLPFDVGLPGFPLSLEGALDSKFGWSLMTHIGLNRDQGPYLVTDHPGGDAEIFAGVGLGAADVDPCTDDQASVDKLSELEGGEGDFANGYIAVAGASRCMAGRLGFLQLTVRDGVDVTPDDDSDHSDDASHVRIDGGLTLDADDSLPASALAVGGRKVGLDQLVGGAVTPVFAAEVAARVNVLFRTGIAGGDSAGFPSILGTLHLGDEDGGSWSIGVDTQDGVTGGGDLGIGFDHLYLDLGSVIEEFIDPIRNEIRRFTEPFQPTIDVLRAEIPIISDFSKMFGGEAVRLLDLMEAAGGDLSMVDSILGLVEFINKGLGTGGLIGLGNSPGSFDFSPDVAMDGPLTSDQAGNAIQNEHAATSNGCDDSFLNTLFDDASVSSLSDGRCKTFGVEGLSFPVLNDPATVFKALVGQDIDLVLYDTGYLVGSAGFDYTFGPFAVGPVPVTVTIGGEAGVKGRFSIGYDTSGLRKLLETGSGVALFDGIFLNDLCPDGTDCSEIIFFGKVYVSAAATVYIVSAGIEGGIGFELGLDLDDSPNPDGKLRIEEIVNKLHNPICLFVVKGEIFAYLNAFLEFDFFIDSVKFTFELLRITLLKFEVKCEPPPPNLADIEGGDLVLNLGERSAKRNVFTTEVNEEFVVRQIDDDASDGSITVAITAFGIYEEEKVPNGGQVFANGSDGNDKISLEGLIEDVPDPENPGQTIQHAIPFTLPSEIYGGDGNDTLNGGDGPDMLDGGKGNDKLYGRNGDDILIGGPNTVADDETDVDGLNGGNGDDVLIGGAHPDTISGGPGADKALGGPGEDVLMGGPGAEPGAGGAEIPDGADLLVGGEGKDTLNGGPAADWLFGDDDPTSTVPLTAAALQAFDPATIDVANVCADETAGSDDHLGDILGGDTGNDVLFGGPHDDELIGSEGNDTLCGNAGDDRLDGDGAAATADQGDDRLFGGSGHDDLFGLGGDDRLEGGGGNDELEAGDGDDKLIGGDGRDRLEGGNGHDLIVGDTGTIADGIHGIASTVTGLSGFSTAFALITVTDPVSHGAAITSCGTLGKADLANGNADCIFAGAGNDVVFAEGGNDIVRGEDGRDFIRGNKGADSIRGGNAADWLFGDQDVDTIFGDSGDDYIEGNQAGDRIRGGLGQDDLIGGSDYMHAVTGWGDTPQPDGGDTIFGDAGHDVIAGDNAVIQRAGTPLVFAANGRISRDVTLLDVNAADTSLAGGDVVYGNAGDDLIFGQANGDDIDDDLDGLVNEDPVDDVDGDGVGLDNDNDGTTDEDGGGDYLRGGPGDDYIEGNAGSDWLFGDDGQDDLIGGSSALDGVIDDDRNGDGANDLDDVLIGDEDTTSGDDGDILAGDNARILRDESGSAWPTHPVTGDVVRTVVLFDVELVGGDPVSADASGDDVLWGAGGRDMLFGQGGADEVHGGPDDDYIEGNHGSDRLWGDAGEDDLVGGGSADDGVIPDAVLIGVPPGHEPLEISGDGLADDADHIWGDDDDSDAPGDGGDNLAGDNALVIRLVGDGEWVAHPVTGNAVREVTLFDVETVGAAASPDVHGADFLFGEGGEDAIFGQGDRDEGHGGPDDDYLEGNHDVDTLFGDGGEDDVIGGGSANDGVIDDDRIGDGLLDEGDVLYGDDGANAGAGDDVDDGGDTVAGDNARVLRAPLLEGGDWQRHPVTGISLRNVVLFDVELDGGAARDPSTSGPDRLFGEGAADTIFGQGDGDLGHGGSGDDYLEGNHGQDVLYGDGGQDDVIGGGSADDGVIDADRQGDLLLDTRDTLFGDDGLSDDVDDSHDVIAGDNARVIKRYVGSAWDTDPNTGAIDRDVLMFDLQFPGPVLASLNASGPDQIHGEGGRDLLFGQGNGVEVDVDGDGRFNEDPPDGVDNDRDGRELAGSSGVYDCADGAENDSVPLLDGADGSDPDCLAKIDEEFDGDVIYGGSGPDWIEGNHGGDWIFGDDGEDDIHGGSASGDGVYRDVYDVATYVSPENLLDGDDTVNGGAEDDAAIGDNGTIFRPADDGGMWLRRTGAAANGVADAASGGSYDIVVRSTVMAQVPKSPGTFGNDHLRGNADHDELYGQLGHDLVEGNTGDDVLVGDLGRVTTSVEDGTNERLIRPNEPFFEDTIYQTGTLTRRVELFAFQTGGGGEGNDTLLGGDGDDKLHGGPGDDLMNGDGDGDELLPDDSVNGRDPNPDTRDEDYLMGGDGDDVMWGGRKHDHLWGGHGRDFLDVRPRAAHVGTHHNRDPSRPADPPTWFTYGRTDHYQGLDIIYGGWDSDAMQANIADNGPAVGDRLIDWVGAYNIYYVCPATYGEYVITRDFSPAIQDFLEDLVDGDGAFGSRTQGASGFRELAMVFAQQAKHNSHPAHPETPGHFTCT